MPENVSEGAMRSHGIRTVYILLQEQPVLCTNAYGEGDKGAMRGHVYSFSPAPLPGTKWGVKGEGAS